MSVRTGLPQREHGVVLFIALVVMVALSLAGVALVRSVETTTAVVGNLGLRQAALLPANLAVEEATAALFGDANRSGNPAITDTTANLPAQNYFAYRLPGEDVRGVPLKLQRKSNFDLPRVLYADKDSLFEVRYVIERSCVAPGPATAANCDMMPPIQESGTTIGDSAAPAVPPIPFYRLTVRVDGPQNTTAFLQAMLR